MTEGRIGNVTHIDLVIMGVPVLITSDSCMLFELEPTRQMVCYC